jgi:endonuclease VIII
MPEGPSIAILREAAARFARKKIVRASGTAALDFKALSGRTIRSVRSFGKECLFDLGNETLRIHLMLFGSYRIDDPRDTPSKLRLEFARGQLDFYACKASVLDGAVDDLYDWRGDVMSESWDPRLARRKLLAHPATLACDALMDQTVFAGVGNIIKNEVLFRVRVHPLAKVGDLPTRKLGDLVREARTYSFQFLAWKKAGVLKKHWLAYHQDICPRDHVEFRAAELGKGHRTTYFCEVCQQRYE